jgi:CO dehydrogenase/acetyl-CoA synthase alpha subunit
MVRQMDKEGFGNCTVTGSCEAVCPKDFSLSFTEKSIADLSITNEGQCRTGRSSEIQKEARWHPAGAFAEARTTCRNC